MTTSKEYICELCKKVFNQKIDFTRHKNKKMPCISIDKINTIIQTDRNNTDIKIKLSTLFKVFLKIY